MTSSNSTPKIEDEYNDNTGRTITILGIGLFVLVVIIKFVLIPLIK